MNKCFYKIIESIARTVPINGPAVEIGSLVVNDKYYIKNLFDCEYIGIDMRHGPGVDIVCNSHNIELNDNYADFIICSSMLEHDTEPEKTMNEIKRILKPDGKVFITVPFNWSIHAYPDDYWRFTTNGLEKLMKNSFIDSVQVFSIGPELKPHSIIGLYGMSFTMDQINDLNTQYPHSNGRVYYYTSLFFPPIMFAFYKYLRYGRKV